MCLIPLRTCTKANHDEAAMPCINHQTSRIAPGCPGWHGLVKAVAVVREYFCDCANWAWRVTATQGSITFQHKHDSRKPVVSVFIDHGGDLARKYGLHLCGTPIVIGVELTHMSPYERDLIRQDLRDRFRCGYMDPTNLITPKTCLLPATGDHRFDIIFLDKEHCTLRASKKMLCDTDREIREGLNAGGALDPDRALDAGEAEPEG